MTTRESFDVPEAAATVPGRRDIDAAAQRIAPWIRRTPVMAVDATDVGLDHDVPVWLKLELTQQSGSFKVRGALNRMLSADVPAAGVIAASGGNFGLAVAHAALRLGHPAEVFVPESSSAVKVARLRGYGASVNVGGAFYAEALEAAEQRAQQTGALWMHAFDQPAMVAGNGTVARELAGQVELDTVLVAVGGGGLLGGVGAWYAGDVRVVGVETELTASLTAALAAGSPVDAPVGGLAADALGARRVGDIGFAVATMYVEQVVLVDDDAVVRAQRRLWDQLRTAVEPAAAVGLAALAERAYRPAVGERVGVLLCGANLDPATLAAIP
jgi:threonine dehydratase